MAKSFEESVILCVGMLCENWGKTATRTKVETYKIGLEGLSPEAVEFASSQALKTCKFMPAAAELRELAGEVKLTDRAQRAWLAFDQALTRFSCYSTLNFDDPVINAVVRSLGGLPVVVEVEPEEYHGNFRVRWIKAYEALANAPQTLGAEQCGPLLGYYGKMNGESNVVQIATGLPPLPNMPRLAATAQKPAAIVSELAKRLTEITRGQQ